MFKFQRLFSGGGRWTDNLFIEELHIGVIGYDPDGIFIKTNRKFTLSEINLLIAQLLINNPNLSTEKLDILPYEM